MCKVKLFVLLFFFDHQWLKLAYFFLKLLFGSMVLTLSGANLQPMTIKLCLKWLNNVRQVSYVFLQTQDQCVLLLFELSHLFHHLLQSLFGSFLRSMLVLNAIVLKLFKFLFEKCDLLLQIADLIFVSLDLTEIHHFKRIEIFCFIRELTF